MKKVLVISSSPRKDGNSDLLCQEFCKGANNAGHKVEYVRLADKTINYCIGCYACEKLGKCFQNDDLNDLAKKMENAEVIVLATPVYFYSMSGQLKVFLDRLVQNYTKIHADIYLIATAWDSDEDALESTIEAIRGATRDCYEGCTEKGAIKVGGVNEKGEVLSHPAMKTVFDWGKNC